MHNKRNPPPIFCACCTKNIHLDRRERWYGIKATPWTASHRCAFGQDDSMPTMSDSMQPQAVDLIYSDTLFYNQKSTETGDVLSGEFESYR